MHLLSPLRSFRNLLKRNCFKKFTLLIIPTTLTLTLHKIVFKERRCRTPYSKFFKVNLVTILHFGSNELDQRIHHNVCKPEHLSQKCCLAIIRVCYLHFESRKPYSAYYSSSVNRIRYLRVWIFEN